MLISCWGEMRDLETISLMLTAAETGLLVFGTLHTNNSRKSVADRIVDVFFPSISRRRQHACGVVARRHCAMLLSGGRFSRLAVHEILVSNSAVSAIIRKAQPRSFRT